MGFDYSFDQPVKCAFLIDLSICVMIYNRFQHGQIAINTQSPSGSVCYRNMTVRSVFYLDSADTSIWTNSKQHQVSKVTKFNIEMPAIKCKNISSFKFGVWCLQFAVCIADQTTYLLNESDLKSFSESYGTSRTKPAWRVYTKKLMYTALIG